MASRGRRRPRVDASESDDEDVRVLNEINTSAPSRSQHILLSDDEDESFTPPVSLPLQQMPAAWQPVVDFLHGRGVKPRTEWLSSCLNQLAASNSGFAQMPPVRKAELCFEQFLMADFNVAGAAVLPPSIHTLHATELPGPFVLQVDEVTDISNSSRDRYQEKPAGPGRTLKLSMTDGIQRVFGMEYRPIRAIKVLSPAGLKVSLRNVCIRRGLLMLVPEILEILGGVVDHLEAARLRAVETINKPIRGRRVARGAREPSLAERATRAAWPDETGEDSRVPPSGSRSSTGITTPGTTQSLTVGGLQQTEQHAFNSQDQGADLRRSSAQVTPALHSVRSEAESPAPQDETVQLNQRAQRSREAVSGFVTYKSTSVDVVQQVQQQHYPLQPDQNVLSSRQSGRGSGTPQPIKVDVVQEVHHQRCQEEHGAESSILPGSNSVIHQSVRVETVQQGGQEQQQPWHHRHEAESSWQSSKVSNSKLCAQSVTLQRAEQCQVLQNRQAAQPVRQSVTQTAEGSTPVSSQSPGAPFLSPSFGKLSLRSRRSTQAAVLPQTNLQSSQPSQLSHGDEPERAVEITESQESELGPSAEDRTTASEIPFTYLTTLDDTRKSHLGQDIEARGRVKCVIAGVGKFEYKGCDEFKLLLHIEDGTLITECSVAHQVVQDLVGHAPVEVSSKLANPDTHQEMLENMIRFQKFLERFEGYMDLEFRNSSPVPIVVNIVEGVESPDAKCLYRRLERSFASQVPTGVKETINLLTP